MSSDYFEMVYEGGFDIVIEVSEVFEIVYERGIEMIEMEDFEIGFENIIMDEFEDMVIEIEFGLRLVWGVELIRCFFFLFVS